MGAYQLVHTGIDSVSAQSFDRLGRERLRVKRLKVSVLSLGSCIQHLPTFPHNESVNPNGNHSLNCIKLHKEHLKLYAVKNG